MTKRVIVTGASGFIGRQTIPLLIQKGYHVHGVYIGDAPYLPKQIHQHPINILEPTQIQKLMDEIKPTHLLHFAWDATPGKYWTSPKNLDWVKASIDLLHYFALNGGKRLVMAGSCAEYDWSNGLCDETHTPLKPSTLYGTCKAALSHMMLAYAKQSNISAAWGRIFFLYGPHEYPVRLVPDVIRSLLINRHAKCTHGNQIRDFLHVKDVADAFATLLDSELTGPINIASGQPITLKEITQTIATYLDAPNSIEYGAIPAPPNEPPKILANTTRLNHELGWSPKYSIQEGLQQTIKWWEQELKRDEVYAS